MEGETDQSVSRATAAFPDRALPNLADNIKCGNSLIGPDYFTGKLISDPDEMKRVNPFDWKQGFPEAMKAGGFDCVIGNPPYVLPERDGGSTSRLLYVTFSVDRKGISTSISSFSKGALNSHESEALWASLSLQLSWFSRLSRSFENCSLIERLLLNWPRSGRECLQELLLILQ